MANGTVKLAKKSFAYGGKMYNQGGKPDYIDIDGDGNKTESMKSAAKEAKTPKAKKDAGKAEEEEEVMHLQVLRFSDSGDSTNGILVELLPDGREFRATP